MDLRARFTPVPPARGTTALEIRQPPRKNGINKRENKLDAETDRRHNTLKMGGRKRV